MESIVWGGSTLQSYSSHPLWSGRRRKDSSNLFLPGRYCIALWWNVSSARVHYCTGHHNLLYYIILRVLFRNEYVTSWIAFIPARAARGVDTPRPAYPYDAGNKVCLRTTSMLQTAQHDCTYGSTYVFRTYPGMDYENTSHTVFVRNSQ